MLFLHALKEKNFCTEVFLKMMYYLGKQCVPMNVAILLTIPVLRILRVIHWSAKKLISNEKPHIPMGYKF